MSAFALLRLELEVMNMKSVIRISSLFACMIVLGAGASAPDEGDTSGGSAMSGPGSSGRSNEAAGSKATSSSPSEDGPIALDHWRDNPQIRPLIQIVLDSHKTALDRLQVAC